MNMQSGGSSLLQIVKTNLTEMTVNNSVATINIPDLQFNMPSKSRYAFLMHLICQANILGSWRFHVIRGGTSGGSMLVSTYQNRGVGGIGSDVVANSNTTLELVTINGIIATNDPGAVEIKFAQQFAHASDAKIYPGSSLVAWQLEI
jgi:hypothetical protein